MDDKNKELKKAYKSEHRRMGIFQIHNLVNDKVFIRMALDLAGIINRARFELQLGGFVNKALQSDWKEFGADKFAFEILDELTPSDDPERDYRGELVFLEDMWLDQVQPYGERGYNEPKKDKDERLQMIARKRIEAQRARDEQEEMGLL